jgi:hypothetical protein
MSTAAPSFEPAPKKRVIMAETPALKLYHAPASPNSRRVRMFLAEKGISVPLVSVDLAAGEQHRDAYLAINPRRVVPALVLEDGTAIGEVLAILALPRGHLSRDAIAWRDSEAEGSGDNVGAAGGAGRLRCRDGGRAQRRAQAGGPRDRGAP